MFGVWVWVGVAIFYVVIMFAAALIGCFEGITVSSRGINADLCAYGAASLLITVGGVFVGLTGVFLDFVTLGLIVHLGEVIGKGSGVGNAIALGWETIRNLVNLAFILGLVYAAFSMILQTENIKPGKLVANILIAAILVNFSYFFAAVVIDTSNYFSKLIYEQVIYVPGQNTVGERLSGDIGQPGYGFPDIGEATEAVIGVGTAGASQVILGVEIGDPIGSFLDESPMSTRFMNATRLGTLHDFKEGIQLGPNPAIKEAGGTIFLLGVLAALLFGATATAFASVGFMFVQRFITIIFLLITAPVGILAFSGLPTVSAWGQQWWKTLIAQALFPPIFFLLMGVSFIIIEGLIGNLVRTSFTALITDGTLLGQEFFGALNLIVTFSIAIGFIMAATQIAKSVSQEVAGGWPTGKDIYGAATPIGLAKMLTDNRAVKWGAGLIKLAGRIPGSGRALRELSGISSLGRGLRRAQKLVGAAADALGADRLTRLGKTPAERVRAGAQKLRDEELLALLGVPWDKLKTDEQRERLVKLVEGMTDEDIDRLVEEAPREKRDALRNNLGRALAESKAGYKKPAEKKPEKPAEEKPSKKPPQPASNEPPKAAANTNGGIRAAERLSALDGSSAAGIVRELQRLEKADARRFLVEERESMKDLLAERKNAELIVGALGKRAADILPANALTSSAFIEKVNAADLSKINGREDISGTEFKRLEEALLKAGKGDIVDAWRATPAGRLRKSSGEEDQGFGI